MSLIVKDEKLEIIIIIESVKMYKLLYVLELLEL